MPLIPMALTRSYGQLDGDPDRVQLALSLSKRLDGGRHQHGAVLRAVAPRRALPHGHHKTITITAARRAGGSFAIDLMDGATNGAWFRTYVADTLLPALEPGDIVVMDNLSAHKVKGIRRMVEAAGVRLLYLPAYSPEFDPIENAFAKSKARLRTAANRTVLDLHDAIRHAFTRFTSQESRNRLAAAGYDAYDST